MSPHERAHYEALLMKVVDGVATAAEQAELDAYAATDVQMQAELTDFSRIKETTDAMTQRILATRRIEAPRPAPRRTIGAAFGLVFAGLALLLGYAAYALAVDPSAPLVVKLGAGALGLGVSVLFFYLLWIRLRGAGRDPYEEIDQ